MTPLVCGSWGHALPGCRVAIGEPRAGNRQSNKEHIK